MDFQSVRPAVFHSAAITKADSMSAGRTGNMPMFQLFA
ncbi:MAG: hypothetical protein QOE73_1037 [Verrucomicrobiota bacterium]